MGHEDGGVALLEEQAEALQAQLELLVLGHAHVVGQLVHALAGLGFILRGFDGGDEKLQGRFLQYDGGVRGLRLGGSG